MDLYTIKKCSNCPKKLVNLDDLALKLQKQLDDLKFNQRLAARTNPRKSPHHQKFHIALAGCPNCCSQPQIKDFGAIGQVVPEIKAGCSGCGCCATACPEAAIDIDATGAIINRDLGLNWGVCIKACPDQLIHAKQTGLRLLAGGKLGRHPRLATEIMPLASQQQATTTLATCADLFLNQGQPGERFGQLMERVNWPDF